MAIKLLSRIWKFSKKWKLGNNPPELFFKKFPRKIWISKNRNVFIRTLADEYVYKISRRYLEKPLSFAVSNDQKGHFLCYFGEAFGILSIINFCPIWAVQKVL